MPTALFSVYDKEDVVAFSQALIDLGWDIIASGGTAKAISGGGVRVKDIADLVGGEPILGHRVVTLSREIHAGLLAREGERDELKKLGIPWIDMVVVDMYPLKETIEMPGVIQEMVTEATDIGGPALLRSAAKGNRIVVCDKQDWPMVSLWLKYHTPKREWFIDCLAAKAERLVADYCLMSAHYRSEGSHDGILGKRVSVCTGENRWQSPAGLYSTHNDDTLALGKFELIEGIAPSYTNWRDLDRLLQTLTHIAAVEKINIGHVSNIAVGVKHGNPCGAAVASTPEVAIEDMVYGNSRAIFGGMVMTNFPITEELAHIMVKQDTTPKMRIFDGVAAPDFSKGGVKILKRDNGRCRLYKNEALHGVRDESIDREPLFVQVRGGFLRQPNYTYILRQVDMRGSSLAVKHGMKWLDVYLAWAVGSTSNSNTITLVMDGMLIGNGVGQQDRVGACELAIKRADDAGHSIEGATAYSDSFFPFNDGPQILIDAGVGTIITTDGSVNDNRLKELCESEGILLLMIPDARGRGFFGH